MNASTGPASMAVSPQGDFVHTPLRRKDGSVVLVNRGWSPRSKGRSELLPLCEGVFIQHGEADGVAGGERAGGGVRGRGANGGRFA